MSWSYPPVNGVEAREAERAYLAPCDEDNDRADEGVGWGHGGSVGEASRSAQEERPAAAPDSLTGLTCTPVN